MIEQLTTDNPTRYEQARRLMQSLSLDERVRLCRESQREVAETILALIETEDVRQLQVDRILSALAEKVQGGDSGG